MPESIHRHLHFKGMLHVKIDKEHSFKLNHFGSMIENEIFWNGLVNGYEKHSMRVWIKLAKNARIILDVGANTGVYALCAQCVNPNARVFAIEPVKRVFEKLEYNIRLNKYPIQALETAFSDYDGTATIYDTGDEHITSVTVNKNRNNLTEIVSEVQIPTTRLDTFIRNKNLPEINLMKLDVETHEPEVLEGMGTFLQSFRPNILIEVLYEDVAEKLNKIFEGLNYKIYYIDENAGLQQVEKMQLRKFYNYLLMSPTQTGLPDATG